MVFADTQWFRPTTEKEVTAILEENKGKKIKFLFGNTAHGNTIINMNSYDESHTRAPLQGSRRARLTDSAK